MASTAKLRSVRKSKALAYDKYQEPVVVESGKEYDNIVSKLLNLEHKNTKTPWTIEDDEGLNEL